MEPKHGTQTEPCYALESHGKDWSSNSEFRNGLVFTAPQIKFQIKMYKFTYFIAKNHTKLAFEHSHYTHRNEKMNIFVVSFCHNTTWEKLLYAPEIFNVAQEARHVHTRFHIEIGTKHRLR